MWPGDHELSQALAPKLVLTSRLCPSPNSRPASWAFNLCCLTFKRILGLGFCRQILNFSITLKQEPQIFISHITNCADSQITWLVSPPPDSEHLRGKRQAFAFFASLVPTPAPDRRSTGDTQQVSAALMMTETLGSPLFHSTEYSFFIIIISTPLQKNPAKQEG